MSAEYRYTIEGEKLTLAEIKDRVYTQNPALTRDKVKARIDAGKRTWAELTMDPAAAKRQAPRVFKQGMARGVAVIMERRRR